MLFVLIVHILRHVWNNGLWKVVGCEVVGRYETLDGRVRHAARLLRPWSPPVNLLGTVSLRQTTLELWPVVGAVPSLTSEITIPSFIVVLRLLAHFPIVLTTLNGLCRHLGRSMLVRACRYLQCPCDRSPPKFLHIWTVLAAPATKVSAILAKIGVDNESFGLWGHGKVWDLNNMQVFFS